MGAEAGAGLADEIRHAPQVALESVEIDDERRRIDVGEAMPAAGG
jgi:hypothetical protein